MLGVRAKSGFPIRHVAFPIPQPRPITVHSPPRNTTPTAPKADRAQTCGPPDAEHSTSWEERGSRGVMKVMVGAAGERGPGSTRGEINDGQHVWHCDEMKRRKHFPGANRAQDAVSCLRVGRADLTLRRARGSTCPSARPQLAEPPAPLTLHHCRTSHSERVD
eukprot:1369728-Rhodomonas_salina.1